MRYSYRNESAEVRVEIKYERYQNNLFKKEPTPGLRLSAAQLGLFEPMGAAPLA
jgi:hypothetical protein